MTGQVAPRPVGLMLGLQCTLHPLLTNRVYREIAAPAARGAVRALADPHFKARDRWRPTPRRDDAEPGSRGPSTRSTPCSSSATLPTTSRTPRRAWRLVPGGRAAIRSTSPTTSCLADGGRAFLYLPFLNYADGNLDAVGEMLAPPIHRPGPRRRRRARRHHLRRQLPDDAPFDCGSATGPRPARPALPRPAPDPRHRPHGRSARPRRPRARLPGRRQRHRLRALGPGGPRSATTFPPAASGSSNRPTATSATIVAGEVTYEHGEPTGPLPGRLVRGPQPAPTNPRSNGATR